MADITESLARHKQKTHRQKKSFTHTTTVTKDNKRMFIELMICFPSTIFVVDWLILSGSKNKFSKYQYISQIKKTMCSKVYRNPKWLNNYTIHHNSVILASTQR